MSAQKSFWLSDQQERTLNDFLVSLNHKDVPQKEALVFLKVNSEHAIFKVYFTVLSLQPIEGKLLSNNSPSEWRGTGEIRRFNPSMQKYVSVSQLSFLLSTSYHVDPNLITGGQIQFSDLNWL